MTVDPNTPHDTLVKELLGSPGDAAAVLQTVLPVDVQAAIDWTSLQRDDTELRAKHEASTRTDLLFRAKARVRDEHHEVMVLVVIEHQSTDDWTMPLRAPCWWQVFAEGKREGEREEERKTRLKLLTRKFGALSESDLRRIDEADDAALDAFLERVLTADSIAAVLGSE